MFFKSLAFGVPYTAAFAVQETVLGDDALAAQVLGVANSSPRFKGPLCLRHRHFMVGNFGRNPMFLHGHLCFEERRFKKQLE